MRQFLLAALLAFTFSAQAQLNITLQGHLSYGSNELSNLWGYTDPNGVEYAIVGTYEGVSIVSLADPTNPVQVQFLPGIQTIWREVKTFSHYAYVSNEGGDGVRIIDLSTLPNTVAYKDTMIGGIVTSHTVSETDGFLYMNGCGGNSVSNGTIIFDLNNDPWRPEYVGSYDTRYVHDCYVRGNTLYAGQINDGLLAIADITDKSNPVELGTHSYTNSFTHNTWLNDAGNVCYTTDERAEAYVYAWDITDPSNIIEKDKIRGSQSQGLSIPHNVHVKNDFLVTSYYRDGVVIFDGANPSNLVEVAYYDTSPTLDGDGFNGAWGVYPYFASGNIIVSDIENGLYVLKPTLVRACYLEGIVTNASTGANLSGATVTFQGTNDVSDNAGAYAVGTATAGTYSATFSRPGFISQTLPVTLSNGVVTTLNVQLVPQVSYATSILVLDNATQAPIPNAKVYLSSASIDYNLTTNTNGQANNSMIAETYTVYVGKWGYRTVEVPFSLTSTNTSTTIYLDKGYYDDFFFDFGWTATGTASSGDWVREEPVGTEFFPGTFASPETDVSTDFGDKVYTTGNGGGSVGDDDVDGGYVTLTSPVFDLTTYTNPRVSLSYWFANGGGGGTPNDYLSISITNGTSTQTVWNITGINNNFWKKDSFLVSQFVTPSANMRLIVKTEDVPSGNVVEAAIDGFKISGAPVVAKEESQNFFVSLMPNPNKGNFELNYNFSHQAERSLRIYDMSGKEILQQNIQDLAGKQKIEMQAPQGLYLLQIYEDGLPIKALRFAKY